MLSFNRRRILRLAILAVLVIAALVAFTHLNLDPTFTTSQVKLDYVDFFDGMNHYAIVAPSLKDNYKKEGGKAESKMSSENEFLLSKEYLESILDISDDTFKKLKSSHESYVKHMDQLIKVKNVHTFGKLRRTDPEWKSYEGSKGYVIIGGGKYSWLAYLVVQQIRAGGGVAPIEVFIPSVEEYERDFCEIILPKYNARCNVLAKSVAEKASSEFKIGGYQFKMFAILTSAFENVMYLDSDLFPTKNTEYLFESGLFKAKGLILWPDAWARTTNPKYHEIAGIPVNEKKVRFSPYDENQAEKDGISLKPLKDYTFANSPFHTFENSLPDPTSEAGVLLVNKTSHLKTLLLALYYNVFGPDFYYPLMTQGGAGEGDKETFIAAASVMKEPYFQTQKQFKWVGYHSKDEGKFVSKALGHYDPLFTSDDADLIFMHCSYPKYYTDWFYNNHDLIYKDNIEHIRMYKDIYQNVGYDFDLRLQQFFVQGVCKDYYKNGKAIDSTLSESEAWAGNFLQYIAKDLELNNKRCSEVYLPHLEWLKSTTEAHRK